MLVNPYSSVYLRIIWLIISFYLRLQLLAKTCKQLKFKDFYENDPEWGFHLALT